MRILGIDPGLANTGWGVIEPSGSRLRCVAYGCITTDPAAPVHSRLAAIHDELREIFVSYRPSGCAVETIFFSGNAKSAFATGQARGAALVAAARSAEELGHYGPREVKLAVVGTGSADKKQVQYMVRSILGLVEDPTPDHAADALALAICHMNMTSVTRAISAASVKA